MPVRQIGNDSGGEVSKDIHPTTKQSDLELHNDWRDGCCLLDNNCMGNCWYDSNSNSCCCTLNIMRMVSNNSDDKNIGITLLSRRI